MKTIKIDLDVDFIGGQGSLSVEEEKALSEFFVKRKLSHSNSIEKRSKAVKRSKKLLEKVSSH
ncbi:MAG: hypothetical protein WCK78_03315 [Paludibacter sp.]